MENNSLRRILVKFLKLSAVIRRFGFRIILNLFDVCKVKYNNITAKNNRLRIVSNFD